MKNILVISYSLLFTLLASSANFGQQSHLISININSVSLQNNKMDIPFGQPVAIYLPPSYDNSQSNYPVVYFLPGFGDHVNYWTDGNYQNFKLKESMDNLIKKGTIKEFIVVIPSGYNFMGGSFYVNSPVTGNWEDFIVKEVVSYVDENYRTIKNAKSRGISGHSMGGFGAVNLAMLHPDIFGSVYSLSPGLFDKNGLSTCQLFKSQTFINQIIQKVQEYSGMPENEALSSFKSFIQARYNSGDWDTPFAYAYGAAFSPNPGKTVPHTDYPYSNSGSQLLIDSVILLNYENGYGGLTRKITDYKENLLKLNGIVIDYGLNDDYPWIPKGCEYFSTLLSAAGIQHEVETFNGAHENMVRSRIEEHLLPFFSGNLVFDTTATGIKQNSKLQEGYNLYQNYPNPFNPETTISFSVSKGCDVSLKVFDILGKEIAILADWYKSAGSYSVKFKASGLAAGIYTYRLKAGNFIDVKKLVVMK